MFFLNSTTSEPCKDLNEFGKDFTFADWTSVAANIAAAFFLICALLPGFMDARKYRKTFFIEENFFKYFFYGASLMWLNAAVMFVKFILGCKNTYPLAMMFGAFLISNTVSAYVNFYSWNMKKNNMAEAEKMGISEMEYWEKVIAPTLEVK